MQVPFEQICGAAQTLPQAPQLFESYCTFTQALPQWVCGSMQPHWPLMHSSDGPHAFPQAPQLNMSRDTSVQVPLHMANDPPEQVLHCPDWQS